MQKVKNENIKRGGGGQSKTRFCIGKIVGGVGAMQTPYICDNFFVDISLL